MPAHRIHGESVKKSTEYWSWLMMTQRCYNPSNPDYKNYGGRGIKVCDRWLNSFVAFLEDMGRKPDRTHTLDRRDCNAHYTPENCRWATKQEQSDNRRYVRRIEWLGITDTLRGWSNRTGVAYSTLKARFRNGWSVERALTT